MRALLASALAFALVAVLASCTLDPGGDDDGNGSGAPCGGFAGGTCGSDEYCDFATNECGAADGGGTCQARPSGCPDIYAPVRGSDGQVYGNACEAHAAGADDCGAP